MSFWILMAVLGAAITLWGLRAPKRHGPRAYMAVCGRTWATAPTRRLAVMRCRSQLGPGAYVVDVWDVPEDARVAENGSIVYDPPSGWSWSEAQALMSPRKIGREEVLKR